MDIKTYTGKLKQLAVADALRDVALLVRETSQVLRSLSPKYRHVVRPCDHR